MYENLLKLPYFQGMSKDELTTILDKVKFDFSRHTNGEPLLSYNQNCENFVILIQGKVESRRHITDGDYALHETLEAPYAIEPGSLFGKHNCYRHNYYSNGDSGLLSINKSYLYSEFSKHNIFGINLLNLISHHEQQLDTLIWRNIPQSIEGRIVRFVALRSQTLTGAKRLIIKMEELAKQLSEARINISRALNNMQQQELLTLSRKEIYIPSFEKLLSAMWPNEPR